MSFKIIFTDIDGTLLDANRELSESTIYQLTKINKQHPIIFVSARMPKQMTHLQQQAQLEGRPLVCYNGALVITGERNSPFYRKFPLTSLMIYLDTIKRFQMNHSILAFFIIMNGMLPPMIIGHKEKKTTPKYPQK